MPTNEEQLAILKDRNGRDVALKGVKVHARLRGLMADIEVEQTYQNPQQTNIEAVYTFPLPLGAVLLGLEVEIAGKTITGHVVERKQAERTYEDAVTDGNSAVMLEEAGPGLYTASLGNLLAGESAVIRYRYGLLLSWQGPRLRFLLPTTIAPRYGDAAAAGLQPHQVPTSSLTVDYPLDLEVSVEGDLASAAIHSPSHEIACGRTESGMVVRLAGNAVLDRDFVLTLESDAVQSSCLLTPDRDGQVALASLRIPPITEAESQPLALKVVIDCSGSMAGISISQARKAALEILNLLGPNDVFNVTLFGSSHTHLFPSMVMAKAKYITEAWNRLAKLDADMGGTEMERALDSVFAIKGPDIPTTVLLITDGEIHEHQKLVKRAALSGHRIFTVGVGTAVAEAFLQSLAKTTRGGCELVAPQDGMTERVLAQFHRMRQPLLGNIQIEWPQEPTWQTPLPTTVFAGDTVHVFAGFPYVVGGQAVLKVAGSSGSTRVAAELMPADEVTLPRLAGARRIESASEEDGLRLALDYQLMSRWTNYLVVAEREAKAEDLPEIHHVPQMLTAGYGGSGVVMDFSDIGLSDTSVVGQPMPVFCRRSSHRADSHPDILPNIGGVFNAARKRISQIDAKALRKLFTPARSEKLHSFLDAEGNLHQPKPNLLAPKEFMAALEQLGLPTTIDELEAYGLDPIILKALRQLMAGGHAEDKVIAAFLLAFSSSSVAAGVDRTFKRVILKEWKRTNPGTMLDQFMASSMAAMSERDWNWTPVAEEVAP